VSNNEQCFFWTLFFTVLFFLHLGKILMTSTFLRKHLVLSGLSNGVLKYFVLKSLDTHSCWDPYRLVTSLPILSLSQEYKIPVAWALELNHYGKQVLEKRNY
jgi:hypothetical protein